MKLRSGAAGRVKDLSGANEFFRVAQKVGGPKGGVGAYPLALR